MKQPSIRLKCELRNRQQLTDRELVEHNRRMLNVVRQVPDTNLNDLPEEFREALDRHLRKRND